jgi:hypothetical protein
MGRKAHDVEPSLVEESLEMIPPTEDQVVRKGQGIRQLGSRTDVSPIASLDEDLALGVEDPFDLREERAEVRHVGEDIDDGHDVVPFSDIREVAGPDRKASSPTILGLRNHGFDALTHTARRNEGLKALKQLPEPCSDVQPSNRPTSATELRKHRGNDFFE